MQITAGRIVGLLIALLAIGGVVWSVVPRPIPVEVAQAIKGHFIATVDEDGKTRVRKRYVVSVPLAGRLSRVELKVGDRVTKGDAIAKIVPSPAPLLDARSRQEAQEKVGAAEASVDRAKTLEERARAQAVQAGQELTRTRTLFERSASTAQALERAELARRVADRDVRAAEFQLHAAEHELEQARALLARYNGGEKDSPETWSVIAPVDGLVLKVTLESETIVQPGNLILEIGDPRDLEVVVDVLSTDAIEIRPGAQVTIERWGGQGMLFGRVSRVEPAAFTKVSTLGVEEQRVNVVIDIVSPSDQWFGLGDGYQVDTKIVVFTQDDATIIPAGALFRRGDTWNVFVVENSRAQIRAVTLLRRSGRFAAVSAGLGDGERVIVYPSDRVSAGTRVGAAPR